MMLPDRLVGLLGVGLYTLMSSPSYMFNPSHDPNHIMRSLSCTMACMALFDSPSLLDNCRKL
jgi:hypothetical protein